MRFLRTNTATRITVGPFLDKTDGITPKVALTVTAEKLTLVCDVAGVPTLILDTAPTASGGSNDMVHVFGDDSGFYDLELAAANVNYVGRAMLSLNDVATHCPVFHEFHILPAAVYDAYYETGGAGLLPPITADWITAAGIADNAIDSATFALSTGLRPVRSGTAQAGGANAITLDAGASATDNRYRGLEVQIVSGTGVDQVRGITAYNGTTKVATVGSWAVNPDATSVFVLRPTEGGIRAFYTDIATVISVLGSAISLVPTALANAVAVWDYLVTSATTVGSMGKRFVDYINASISGLLGSPANGTIAADIAAAQTAINTIGARVMLGIPNAAPGASGGSMILGVNSANATVNFIGNITSVTTAGAVAGAVGSVTILNDISASTLTKIENQVLDALLSGHAVVGSVAASLTSAINPATLLDAANAIETGETLRQSLRLSRSVLAGIGVVSGANIAYKRKDGTTTALTITHDTVGNRSASTVGTL